jgi:3-oxoadipate enol-lactonase/4-carboxymuconolactone decarboxylase
MWAVQARALEGTWRCLRYDMRGHGGSSSPDGVWSISDLADDLAALLTALGVECAHIVGLSLGGMTAQAFASAYPSRVLSLTLMATSAHMPEGWSARIALIDAQGMRAMADNAVQRWFTPAFAADHPEIQAHWRDVIAGHDPAGYKACCAAIAAMDLRAATRALSAPTLLIAGAEDGATPPAMLLDLQSRIAGAQLNVIPQVAHLPNLQAPDVVNKLLLDFLNGLWDASGLPCDPRFRDGLAMRRSVLGTTHVDGSLARATSFTRPWQEFITRTAWHDVWCDPTLPRKTRSLVTLAMMIALGREDEFKLHLRPALNNGVTARELQSLLLHASIYAGVPAVNGAFKIASETLGEALDI